MTPLGPPPPETTDTPPRSEARESAPTLPDGSSASGAARRTAPIRSIHELRIWSSSMIMNMFVVSFAIVSLISANVIIS